MHSWLMNSTGSYSAGQSIICTGCCAIGHAPIPSLGAQLVPVPRPPCAGGSIGWSRTTWGMCCWGIGGIEAPCNWQNLRARTLAIMCEVETGGLGVWLHSHRWEYRQVGRGVAWVSVYTPCKYPPLACSCQWVCRHGPARAALWVMTPCRLGLTKLHQRVIMHRVYRARPSVILASLINAGT